MLQGHINNDEMVRLIGLAVAAWTDEAMIRMTPAQLCELRRYYLNQADRLANKVQLPSAHRRVELRMIETKV